MPWTQLERSLPAQVHMVLTYAAVRYTTSMFTHSSTPDTSMLCRASSCFHHDGVHTEFCDVMRGLKTGLSSFNSMKNDVQSYTPFTFLSSHILQRKKPYIDIDPHMLLIYNPHLPQLPALQSAPVRCHQTREGAEKLQRHRTPQHAP